MAVKRKTEIHATDDAHSNIEFVEALKKQWLETIDAIPDPFMTVSQDFSIIRANKTLADIAETPVKSVAGKRCFEVFAGRSSPCENCRMQDAAKGIQDPSYEIYNEKNHRWYEVASRKLSSTTGPDAIVQIYRDRTEAKTLQSRIAQNEKLASIGQLAGGFAHEINNPLGGILVFSQMLLREMAQDSQHYKDVVEIEAAAKRCKTIVENLLDYARQRPIKPNFAIHDPHEIIPQAVKFAALAHNRQNRCKVHFKFKAVHHKLMTDHNRLTQVIVNLCSNSFQAMPKGGDIIITTQDLSLGTEKLFQIEIKDHGTGIHPENLKKIFEPFFTTKEPGQGTGLGLSIVHGMIQDLNGAIDVKSKLGSGTTVTVTLPVTPIT